MRNKQPRYIELDIESIGFEGVAVARVDDKVHFVKGAVPGDKVIAQILKSKKRYAECRISKILEKSENRITPDCEYFGMCGGCSWQMLDYEHQIAWKKQNVIDSFERIGKIKIPIYHNTIKSEMEFNYRNKMDFSFGTLRWLTLEEVESEKIIERGNFYLGLHSSGRFDKIVDINKCLIQNEYANKILDIIRNKALEMNISAFHPYDKTGFLRNLTIRHSVLNDDFMVILITNDINEQNEIDFLEWYKNDFEKEGKINTLCIGLNNTINEATVKNLQIVRGQGYLIENILGVDFRISPLSFFQTNSYQLNKFVSKIIEYAEIDADDNVWDLYCGTGSITLPLSKICKNVFGFEVSESSIKDAKSNAKLNNLNNVKFYATDLHSKSIPSLFSSLEKPNCIIIDPPRSGIQKNLVETILEVEPEKIVYVSCNPATQARDCELFSEKYDIIEIQTFDMFPQTYHIESIAKLRKKEKN